MEKRVIIATILSTIVILLWWLWFTPQPKREFYKKEPTKEVIQKTQLLQPEIQPQVQNKSEDYTLELPGAIVTFNTLGAKIKNYHLIEGKNKSKLTDLILHPIDNSFEEQNFATLTQRNFKCISVTSNTIILSTIVDKIKLYKKYIFNETGLNLLEFKLENCTNKKQQFDCELILGPGIGCDEAKRKDEISLTKVIALSKKANKITLRKLKENSYNISDCKWIALQNRYYFSAIMLSSLSQPFHFTEVNISKVGNEKLPTIKLPIKTELQPYEKTEFVFEFYVGAKKYSNLKRLQVGFENLINFGFFASLGKVVFFTLQFLYNLTGNYGLAIIILTIIMQIVLLPLTMKSFQSAKALRMLQPKIRQLQLTYKNDPKRLNTEIMYLYKSQKVNPLGGCLPMILQLPIFWALFTVLGNAYELKNAPFVLWIKDLSAPDLLFALGGLPIRLLPLLMGIGMFVQQQLSGSPADPSQKTFTYIMPIMFTFIFWNFPSGLVLYWLTNSIMSIVTQWIIIK